MKISTLLRHAVLTVASLVSVFIFISLLVNFSVFDEDLRPEVISLMQPVKFPLHEGNAYFAIQGMTVAAQNDMTAAGMRLVERNRLHGEKNGPDTLAPAGLVQTPDVPNMDEAWMGDFQNCTARTTYGCLANVRADLRAAPAASQRLQLMMDRHQRILQMTTFESWADSSDAAPLPPYGMMMKLSQFKLASFSDPDSSANFLSQLAIDMRFWRMLLEQGSRLIEKMVGVAGIWTDMQYFSEYLTEHELSSDEARFAMSLLMPLTKSELNIAVAFESEQRALSQALATTAGRKSLFAVSPLTSRWLMQTNATQNSYYEHITEPMLRLSSLSRTEFAARIRTREQHNGGHRKAYGRDAIDSMTTIWPGSLYNLGGNILLAEILGNPEDYIARVHDVNRMIGLVKLQLSLQLEDTEFVERFLRQQDSTGPRSIEVLADTELRFDPDRGWLQFDCLDRYSLCGINLLPN